jgi:hypothetical protein
MSDRGKKRGRSSSNKPINVDEMKQAIKDIEEGRVVTEKSSSPSPMKSSEASSVSPIFHPATKKLKLLRKLRITMGELKKTNLREYQRIKPDFNDYDEMSHLEWQGLENLSEEAFDSYLYAPDAERDDDPPEYDGDTGTVGHPPFITTDEVQNDPDKRYMPISSISSVSADVAEAFRNKLKRKLREISKLKLLSLTENNKFKINKECLPKIAELEQIHDLLLCGINNDTCKAIWEAHGNSEEAKELLKQTRKIRIKVFMYPCRIEKKFISLYSKKDIYLQLYSDLYNLISDHLEYSIHDLFNNYTSVTYDNIFHFDLSAEEKKLLIRYSLNQQYGQFNQGQFQLLTEEELNAEVERIFNEYNRKAVPGGGGEMPYKYIYFQEHIQPYLKDATKLITFNRLPTNKVTPEAISTLNTVGNRLYHIFTPVNPNILDMSNITRHTFFHNLPNKVQSKLLQILTTFKNIQKCFKSFEKLIRNEGIIIPQYLTDVREEQYLEVMYTAWNMVPADKYTFDITSYPTYISSLEKIYKDMQDVINKKTTYRDYLNREVLKNIADYEKDAFLYDRIVNACDKMKMHIITTHAKKTQEIKTILKYIKAIQSMLPEYKRVTSKINKCGYEFINNTFGYTKLLNEIQKDSTRYIKYILKQKTKIINSLNKQEFYLPVYPDTIIEYVTSLNCICNYLQTQTPGIVNNAAFIEIKNIAKLLEQIRKLFRIIIHMRTVILSARQLNIGYSVEDIESLLTEFPQQQFFMPPYPPFIDEVRQFIQDYVELNRSMRNLGYYNLREVAEIHPLLSQIQQLSRSPPVEPEVDPVELERQRQQAAQAFSRAMDYPFAPRPRRRRQPVDRLALEQERQRVFNNQFMPLRPRSVEAEKAAAAEAEKVRQTVAEEGAKAEKVRQEALAEARRRDDEAEQWKPEEEFIMPRYGEGRILFEKLGKKNSK